MCHFYADDYKLIQIMDTNENTAQTPSGGHENHDEYQYINLIKDIIKKGISFHCDYLCLALISI